MKKAFNIDDINVWMLLLKQRPNRRTLDEKSVKIYTDIAKNLGNSYRKLIVVGYTLGTEPNTGCLRTLERDVSNQIKSNQIKSNQIYL